ncbi:hypothetical protein NDR87_20925 [Nocardia sp. CDC159]|uniref:Uncharacterized protein n=1 Tax=Nocardia pulmonis TaxID=2951408 RepID=A0A9X2J0Y1_9NOCA|nr:MULTISPECIES: hypothetical protein [Nocardia]MCM6776411.1 hypothetical protein [Nocardia pulmonis]MCM6788835.1 hypothetical protein [Nocardia sp. CDC159]
MTIENPMGDEVTQLARRVEKARGRMAFQFDPALTEALSEDELKAERELAERIREQEREQRWKNVQAAASASDRARQTSEEIAKADMRDLLMARKAIAAQRRESSPHAKLASLYRHRAWSQRALAGVVVAGMLWSAVNVQHNIAPGGPTDPLYWFSYLLEGMISVCLVIIMIGTNKVAEWGILDSRRQIIVAELALLALTVILNTYPYLRDGNWYDVGVHAVAPVMVGVALLVHDSASNRYGQAIARATAEVKDIPDPAEQIRRTLPTFVSFIRQAAPDTRAQPPLPALPTAPAETAGAKADADVRDAETVDPGDPDIWLPKSKPASDNSSAKSWMSDLKDVPKTNGNGKKAKDRSESEADTDSMNLYDTGQFRIAETLEQELAELRAERRRARAKKQQRATATNGAGDDD